MPNAEEPDGQINIGPSTRVSFAGVAIIGLLGGLFIGAWSAATALWRINTNIDKKLSISEFTRYTIRHQRDNLANGVKVEIYTPPRESNDLEEDRK